MEREMKKLVIGMVLLALAAGCSTDKIHELMQVKPADELVLACKTKVEDRAALRRSFPIDFIALPWESDLNR